MKRTADLEVKEVNIKIKNITSKKVKGLPLPETKDNIETQEKIEERKAEEATEKSSKE